MLKIEKAALPAALRIITKIERQFAKKVEQKTIFFGNITENIGN